MLWERCGGSRSACRGGVAEVAMVIASGDDLRYACRIQVAATCANNTAPDSRMRRISRELSLDSRAQRDT